MHFSGHESLILLFSIGVLLGFSRLLGEISRRFGQPMVMGEIFAGILLGPTVLGRLFPVEEKILFPTGGNVSIAIEGITVIAAVLLLLVAGMEVNLSSVRRQGRDAALVSFMGALVPLAAGFAAAWWFPAAFGREPGTGPFAFALFLGTALSLSELPIIAKTLKDLNLIRSDYGMLILASAAMNDLTGWILFSVVLGFVGVAGAHSFGAGITAFAALCVTVIMLTVVRRSFNGVLPWVQKNLQWPGGVLATIFTFAMLVSALTEWMGIHSIFGAFLAGIAVGDSQRLTERTKDVIEQFTSNIFAPLFFGYIGLLVDFAGDFDIGLVTVIFVMACVTKIGGSMLGARIGGMNVRDSLAVGFGMNSRGAMVIILSLLALEYGVIGESLFVALVVMGVATAMMTAPAVGALVREEKPPTVAGILKSSGFKPCCIASGPREAIGDLAGLAARETGLDAEYVFNEVWTREQIQGTAIGGGIAVPHARLRDIAAPVITAGISSDGMEFDSPDGVPVRLVILILTPERDRRAQLHLLADIARIFSDPPTRAAALRAKDYQAFMHALDCAPLKKGSPAVCTS